MHLIDLADGYYYLQLNLFFNRSGFGVVLLHFSVRPSDAHFMHQFLTGDVKRLNSTIYIFFSLLLIESNSENEHLEVVNDVWLFG